MVRRFPLEYRRYIEVFGGGGWVLFYKDPRRDFEVYNDFNGLLTNLYRCVREKPDLLINALEFVLNSREDFEWVRRALDTKRRATDIQRAAWFYQIIRYSYASGLKSFGSQPHDIPRPSPVCWAGSRVLSMHPLPSRRRNLKRSLPCHPPAGRCAGCMPIF